jgi:HK97 gp10 family phage protein
MPRAIGPATGGDANYYGVQIDMDAILATIKQRALNALNSTLTDITLPRAQHHAPVRAFVRRTPRPHGKQLTSLAVAPGSTRAAIMRLYRNNPITHPVHYGAVMASRAKPRRIDVPEYGGVRASSMDEIQKQRQNFFEQTLPPPGRREEHNNAYNPVVRSRVGKTVTTSTGDFRRVSGGQFQAVAYAQKVTGGKVAIHHPEPTRRVNGQLVAGRSAIDALTTARARYDVEHGKITKRIDPKSMSFEEMKSELKRRRGLTQDAFGVTRYGGTLRDSIIVVKASLSTQEGKGIVRGYVRAGGGGIDYAGYQEFGTRHNRPHPFLRPALYESRGPFKTRVKAFLEGGH